MKNEIEKRQREDESNAKANQITHEPLDASTEQENGTADESTEPEPITNGVANPPTKLVAC